LFSKMIQGKIFLGIEDVSKILATSGLQENIKSFINNANTLAKQRLVPYSEIKNTVAFLSKSSRNDLSFIFDAVNTHIQKHNEQALEKVDQIGILLISLCLCIVFFVWFFVFKPIYTTVLNQHKKLSEAVTELENANRSRSEFLANISHEIRTPMTGILGYAELLQNFDNQNSNEKKEAVKVINQNASHLLGLIDELLDLAKVESEKMIVSKEKFILPKLLNEIYSLMNVKAKEKNIELRFLNQGEYPKYIFSDPMRLKQIILNIISNSIKFTDSGYIELVFSYEDCLKIRVKDTGRGIAKKHRSKLFKAFEQIDSSANRSVGGTGLGLSLSKGLAKQLGGDVVLLHSKLGAGSTFEISIDAGVDSNSKMLKNFTTGVYESPEQEKRVKKLAGNKFLVVDDAKENARLFKIYLTEAGAYVELAHNGDDAIKLAKNNSFDAVLLDIQMPKKDGYQVLKELKDFDTEKPVYALTAHAMTEEKEKTKRAGFDGHITKPVKFDDLVNYLADELRHY
ncbi:MAG: response regulator, partial [Bdellovibrionota bacterium]|nr:response regulator [Bdellovibrionota bacterium]